MSSKDLGLFIIRVGIGALFVLHGYPKLMGGSAQWVWLGSQMAAIGIRFYPTFWGFMAAISEFFGGILLILGLATRFAAFFIACVMLVALSMHFSVGDPFATYSHPLALLVVLVGIFFAGAGSLSIDRMMK